MADLVRGVRPWARPWDAGHLDGRIMRPLRFNGVPYSGINTIMLWLEAEGKGFTSPTWMTFKQAQALGGHMRKGERGSPVVYANKIIKTEAADDGAEHTNSIPYLKGYTVFSVEQIDGLPDTYYARPPPRFTEPVARITHADVYFAALNATIHYRGNRAFYSPSNDVIQMPPIETFRDADSAYERLKDRAVGLDPTALPKI